MTQESLDKKKGIPDIVFLLDASGSMKECIQAVTQNIATFVDTLATPDANGGIQIKDWRIRVIGYRDRDADGSQWLVDNPFSNDIATVKSQLAALEAKGGGDEPESLYDAMYALTQWPSDEKGGQGLPTGWRHRHDAARVVVIFTDASCKPGFKAADGSTGTVNDLMQAYNANKLKVILYAPEAPCYMELSSMSGLEWEPVGALGDNPVQALKDYTSNAANFRKVMEALAKSVSASAAVPTL
jgi:Mg-chelatase subunit ChlD